MSSYQDIETRLQVVEDKLAFIMLSMRQQTVERLPTLDASGQPMVRVTQKTFLELYLEARNAHLANQALASQTARDGRILGAPGEVGSLHSGPANSASHTEGSSVTGRDFAPADPDLG